MVETTVTVTHPVGLHARPAAVFAKTAQGFQANIMIKNITPESPLVNAKSVIGLFKAAVGKGDHTIQITADGDDEQVALDTLRDLVSNNFGE